MLGGEALPALAVEREQSLSTGADVDAAFDDGGVEEDRLAGKRTLVVRLGRAFALKQYGFSIVIALLIPLALAIFYELHWYLMLLIPIVIGHFASRHYLALKRAETKTDFNQVLGKTAKLVSAYAVLFSLLLVCERALL